MSTRALRRDRFRTIIVDAPVSYSVFSAFSFYGARRGGELAGTWLVAALASLGHQVAAIRQTLYRMEGGGVLRARSEGRNKHYRLAPAARGEAEAGLAKIMETAATKWDGRWTIVQMANQAGERPETELLRELIRAEGFARLAPGIFIHPRDRTARLAEAARAHGAEGRLVIFRGERVDATSDAEFVAQRWDLDDLATRYRAFLTRYRPASRSKRAFLGADAFLLRFAMVFDFLETAWRDPELPNALLPARWPGAAAQQLARTLYLRLLPQALTYGDSLTDGS